MTCSSPACSAYGALLDAFNSRRGKHTHAITLPVEFPVLAALDDLGPRMERSFLNLFGQMTAIVDVAGGRATLLLDDFPEERRVMVSTDELELMSEITSSLAFAEVQ